MTPPTGYVEAVRVVGVVKLPERFTLNGVYLQGSIVGPGDTAVIPEGEAHDSDHWSVVEAPGLGNTPAPVTQSVASTPTKTKSKEGND